VYACKDGKTTVNMHVMKCENGHYIGVAEVTRKVRSFHSIDAIAASIAMDEDRLPNFCPKCGAKNLSDCQQCHAPIMHRYPGEHVACCGGCGKPYPWTETALAAAKEFTDELEELTPEEKTALKSSLGAC